MTSIRHRILVDECLPPALITTYLKPHIALRNDGFEAVHFRDLFGGNGKWKDGDFIPKIARDRRWVVISEDAGKSGKRIDSLPLICQQYDVTLIRVSTALKGMGVEHYGPQLILHWEKICEICSRESRGTQYVIRQHNKHRNLAMVTLVRCLKGHEVKNGVCDQCG